MQRTTRKRRKKVTHLEKLLIGLVILFTVLLLFFIVEIVSNKKVEAEKTMNHNSVTTEIKMKATEKEQPSQQTKAKKVNAPTKKEATHDKKQEKKATKEKAKQKKQPPIVSPETDKVVYLTFDDGPHPTASRIILDLLGKYDAKATFFMLEPNMKKNPDILKEMSQNGHGIGVHGVTHEVSKIYRSPTSFVNEMNQAISTIKNITNKQTKLIRAPYGSRPYITPPFKKAADKEDFIMWDWNIDSTDWKLRNGQYVGQVIQQTTKLLDKEPLIVLLHEKVTTANHLEQLLKYYRDNGYKMKALNETMQPVQFK